MSFPAVISQKPSEIPIFRTFLAKFELFFLDFGCLPCSLKIGYFEFGLALLRHCDVIERMFVPISVC